ncbi:cellulose biosynthesis protein BcsQ [Chryseobacterium defluvii]|uniref:Cellulose biosynthesis protein BcsQ n=1 Tax=Chryseobacterium defluvii TaxID=160396 RepID=A0A840KD73_9FLAO|nr:AAA family ATPase [Chryseobacterium defluvii]MBB4805947.1 cellulose biosynthesis protein BcsQ [Chryseobacterium defluvii]
MAKIISLFNHKGGVSKTTTVFHLGWKLASQGRKVLMIDADPQCNLTGLTLGLEDYDSLLNFYNDEENTDIFSSLAPIFELDATETADKKNPNSITPTANENLFILAGNIRFSELDIQIATALTSSSTIPILRKFVGSFNNFVRKIADHNNIDIVLVDMSPSVSSTNHCIFMSSDYFIIPVSPDFYCYQAIDSLSNVLPKWAIDIERFKGTGEDDLPENNPKMLGFITQNYRIYTVNKSDEDETDSPKKMSKVYQDWLDKINDILNSKLVPELQEKDMIVDEELFKSSVTHGDPYHLAGIQNFSGLIPVSQETSKPIYELTETDGNWSGARWKHEKNGKEYGIKVNIEDANKVYSSLAEAITKMI